MSHESKIFTAPPHDLMNPDVPFPPAAEQDVMAAAISKHVKDKGFLLTSADRLFDWARTGSMWPMT
ncbi:MAG: NADH-quinone oxidoreductase subunit B, partial [Alphaproteobacteria bacterium]|nr:NADH-quinone oxidoreductase subunit B [Alphaproteobacteria bacterium]